MLMLVDFVKQNRITKAKIIIILLLFFANNVNSHFVNIALMIEVIKIKNILLRKKLI